jgi:hypothetical protein
LDVAHFGGSGTTGNEQPIEQGRRSGVVDLTSRFRCRSLDKRCRFRLARMR